MSQVAEKRGGIPAMLKDAAFVWEDPLDLEGELTEEERMVRDTARGFAQDYLLPRVLKAYRDEKYDPDIMPEMGELGLLGPTIPEEYGGAGLGYVAYGLIAREIERVDSGYRSTMSVQSSLVMYPIYAYGTEAQRRKYLPKLATGEIDRLLRPDRARPRLRSRLDGDARRESRRRLQAQRRQDVDHQRAGRRFAVVWAKLDGVIRGFIVERGTKGFSTPKIEGKLSLRASITGEIVLEDCVVPEENLLPNVKGLAGPFGCLNNARYGIAWGAMGAAEFCWHRARQYVLDRKQFGRPLAANQLVQKKLADMQTEIALGLHGALRLGRMLEAGTGRAAVDLADEAQQLRQGARHRAARARHARRQRHLRRIPRDARALEPRDGQHLRGHARHPRADPRPRADRHPGVFLMHASLRPRERG